MKKKMPLILTLVMLAGGGWVAFSKHAPFPAFADQTTAPKQYIVRAERRTINTSVELSADVTPEKQLDVRSEVGGKVKAIYVKPGQDVKKGDLLVEIDDTDLQTEKASVLTEIAGAKLVVEKNRRNFDRGKELFNAKSISRENFDNLFLDYAIARNALEKSQRGLDAVLDKLCKTRIVAPTDGTVLNVNVIEGQVVVAAASVNSGTLLMAIADLSKLLVETHVNQIDVSKLRLSQKVTLSTESISNLELEATINFIAPIASSRNNVKGFQVKALIERRDPRLRPGTTVNLSVPVEMASDAVSVPVSAVFKGENDSKVVYLRRGESTEQRAVTVGISDLEHAEIKSGLEAGEEILLIEPRLLPRNT